MPWIQQELCIGCGICIDQCPVQSISMINNKAKIDMKTCIRCGTCHEICPQNAARHDSEKIPQEIEENINWVKGLLTNYSTEEDRNAFLQRIKRHFVKEIKVNEKTLEKIDLL